MMREAELRLVWSIGALQCHGRLCRDVLSSIGMAVVANTAEEKQCGVLATGTADTALELR